MADVIVILMAGVLAGVLAGIEAARWLGRRLRGGFPKSVACGSARVGELCVFGSISRVTGVFELKSGTPLGPKRTPLGPPLDTLLTRVACLEGQFSYRVIWPRGPRAGNEIVGVCLTRYLFDQVYNKPHARVTRPSPRLHRTCFDRARKRRACGFPGPPAKRRGENLDKRFWVCNNTWLITVNLSISIEQPPKKLALFGAADRHLRMIRDGFDVQVTSRNDEINLAGEKTRVAQAAAVLDQLQRKLRRQDWLSAEEVGDAIHQALGPGEKSKPENLLEVFAKGRSILAKTEGQHRYLQTIFENDLTFCLGPAGTGKTYLAVAAAANLLKRGQAKRLILARPAVEAGERLGFLPGDLQAKVNPYLRPLFDALNDMMDFEQVKRFMMNDVIEVVPLAFMRGRTLNDSVVILDEAQNTTVAQMLMFLTRLGNESKMIVTGDASQVDLPRGTTSGLVDAIEKLKGIKGIGVVELERSDIVRHRLVTNIVNAYERAGATG